MRRTLWLPLVCAGFLVNQIAFGQIDPDRREFLEAGFNQSIQGADPFTGYGYYFINEPDFFGTNITFRMALAPVYVDTETGFVNLLGPNTGLGVGLAGGGFADNYYEFRKGKYYPEESFYGHVLQTSLSIYHLFNPGDRIPLNGLLRVTEHYSVYARDDATTSRFVLPPDHSTISWLAGLRWGGRPPELHPNMAMELSGWYEDQMRTASGGYGFDGDRVLNRDVQMFWARALLAYTFPHSGQSFDISLTGGGSTGADRFSAYRAGGNLPLGGEFPLTIPGYFDDELSARNFVLVSAEYAIPLNPGKQWTLRPMASAATMEYVPGLEQQGHFNSGAGIGLGYQSHDKRWDVVMDYGYGFEAIRDTGRGGQTVGILMQVNLGARHPNGPSEFDKAIDFLHEHL